MQATSPLALTTSPCPMIALAVAASTGTLHRNFQGYTTDTADALIAFGASAISEFPQGFAQAARDTLAWTRSHR